LSNRLADATSPYLLQHAHNPVDWFPWGPEALGKAASENKPIFLSIGYASCHWCHVMAHESFEDAEIAEFMNKHFISIKVDREERPDIDSVYMDAVVAMTGQGGWPMSVFLTPGGEPFFGGTYFPPSPMHGMPSFKQVLSSVARAWKSDRQRLVTAGTELSGRIGVSLPLAGSDDDLSSAILDRAADKLFQSYDWTHGGWGGAPKFPQPQVIEFLLQRAAVSRDKLARDMASHALRRMASGGIYDHIGGGFARYAVDAHWTVPHFEKMLYDNAQLISAYLHAWQLTQDAELLAVAQGTVDFVLRELRLPDGGFASSLDADSDGEEGSFYVWDRKELEEIVTDPEHWRLFARAYGPFEQPNFEGRYVLRRQTSNADLASEMSLPPEKIEDMLDETRARVFEARSRRVRPALDDKVLAAWNGMLLQALAQFARATGDEQAADASLQLAQFLRNRMLDGGRPRRAWRTGETSQFGFLEDSAALGLGWLAQYEYDFDPEWFDLAKAQADVVLNHFVDLKGGFFDTADDQADQLLVRPKSVQDSPTPSGNTMAIQLLLRLAALTGDSQRYALPALEGLRAMQDNAARHPTAFAGWLSAIGFALGPQLQLAFIGFKPEADYQRLRSVADPLYLPLAVMAGRDAPSDKGPALLDERAPIQGKPTAYVCREFSCKKPTANPVEFATQLQENS